MKESDQANGKDRLVRQLCREVRHLATLVRMKAYETPELNTENDLVQLSERLVEAVRAAEHRLAQTSA